MGVGHFVSAERRSEFFTAYRAAMRTLPEPSREHDLDTGFGRVRAYRFGAMEGTPVVLLHGRTGTSAMWQPNIEALAERYPVYAVDLLGEPGCSVQSVSIRHGGDQAAWLNQLLAALDLDAVHLLGASFGGWLAMNQAIRAPERVTSVSVLDPPRTFAPLSFRMMAASLGAFPIGPEKFRKWFMTWISGGEDVSMDDPEARLIAASMRCFRVALPLPEYPTDQQLRSVTVPVLALVSGKSTVHDPQKAFDRANRQLRQARVELWPNATHGISAEWPDAVNNTVLDFLDHMTEAEKP